MDSSHPFKPLVRTNKNLIFKDKKYPIDFGLMKRSSNFLYNKRKEYKFCEDIKIDSYLSEISEESLYVFISYCHGQDYIINNSNIFEVYQIATQFETPGLIKITQDYINQNNRNLIFKSINFKLQNNKSDMNLNQEEEMIASNFFEYIDNDELITLPIPILYRILNDKKLNFAKLNENNQNQIIEFLFKCLDHYQKDASILFLNLNLENERIDLINRLLKDYHDVFDFRMINSQCLTKTLSQVLSEFNKIKIENDQIHAEINRFIENENINRKQMNEKFEKMVNERVEFVANDSKKCINELKQQLQKQQELMVSYQNHIKTDINSKHDEFNKSINELKQQIQKQQESITSNQNNIKTDLTKAINSINELERTLKKAYYDLQKLETKINEHDNLHKQYLTRFQLKQIFQEGENSEKELLEKTEGLWREQLRLLGNNINPNLKQLMESIINNNNNSWAKARSLFPPL